MSLSFETRISEIYPRDERGSQPRLPTSLRRFRLSQHYKSILASRSYPSCRLTASKRRSPLERSERLKSMSSLPLFSAVRLLIVPISRTNFRSEISRRCNIRDDELQFLHHRGGDHFSLHVFSRPNSRASKLEINARGATRRCADAAGANGWYYIGRDAATRF